MAAIDPAITAKQYAHPEVLVSTEWLAEHLTDASLRILESDEDVLLYDTGHIPGAQKIDWHADLNDAVQRDYIDRAQFETLVRRLGIDESHTVVFYGDKNNWWAAYAFWVFKLFGFTNAKLLDGGRMKWEAEGRPMTEDTPRFQPTRYAAPERSDSAIRAFFHEVREHAAARKPLVDVRSPQEYTGERTHMPEYPQEGTLRGGHIPGAKSVPWARAANADGSFKPAAELRAIYEREQGLQSTDDVIAYCRIGERSSHTWFVLTYLLGYDKVRNYDGSWTEWGNAVRAPIEKGRVKTIHVEWRGEHRFESALPDGPTLLLDGSAKAAVSPVDALLSALATCAGIDVVEILAKRRTPVESLSVDVTGERVETTPRRIKHVTLRFTIAGAGIERDQAERAIDLGITKYCSVRESLREDIQVAWTLDLQTTASQ